MSVRAARYRCRTCGWTGSQAERAEHVADHPGHRVALTNGPGLPAAPPVIARHLEEVPG